MNSSDGMLIVNVSAIQAVAIAAVTYYFGAWLRKKSSVFRKVLRAESGCVGGVCWLHWYFPAWNISIS